MDVSGIGSIYYIPIGSMYAIYANIGGILMGSMLPYSTMDPMTGNHRFVPLKYGVFHGFAVKFPSNQSIDRLVVSPHHPAPRIIGHHSHHAAPRRRSIAGHRWHRLFRRKPSEIGSILQAS